MALSGQLISVKEVLNEIDRHGASEFIKDWAKKHKDVYKKPTDEELAFVRSIFAIPHFGALIGSRSILEGKPVADPFVIASAKINNGYVVTQEERKPNASKIPNVCDHFKIKCINLEQLMEKEGWSF